MSIKLFLKGSQGEAVYVPHTCFTFSGGEVQVRIPENEIKPLAVTIVAHLRNSDDIMELLLLHSAIINMYHDVPIHLLCPYVPYARQDRVCYTGEACSIYVFACLLQRCRFATIKVWDIHSHAAWNALCIAGQVINIQADTFMPLIPKAVWLDRPVLVAPDEGARLRTELCALSMNVPWVQARKVRDPDTGNITGMEVDWPDGIYDGRPALMIDDICDGGRTFLELAKKLCQRGCPSGIMLYVTHGIFSNGFEELRGYIDHIYTPNPFPTELPDFVTKI